MSRLTAVFFLFILLSSVCKAGNIEKTERIVVIAPAIAEMLEAMDLDQSIVGRGQYGPWSPALQTLTVVGGYNNPNPETVIALETTVVLNSLSQAARDSHKRLRLLGIEVIELDTSTIDGVYQSLQIDERPTYLR